MRRLRRLPTPMPVVANPLFLTRLQRSHEATASVGTHGTAVLLLCSLFRVDRQVRIAVRLSLFGGFKCFSRDDRALYLINTLISKDCLLGVILDFFSSSR